MVMTVIRRSRPTLPHGVVGSRSADHAEAISPQFYSWCMARQGQDNRMLHKALQLSSLPRTTPQ